MENFVHKVQSYSLVNLWVYGKRNHELDQLLLDGRKLFCGTYFLGAAGKREKFSLLRKFPFWLMKDPFLGRFPSFLLNDWSFRWSYGLLFCGLSVPYADIGPGEKFLLDGEGYFHRSAISVVLVPYLRVLTSSQLLQSVTSSSLSVIALSKCNFLFDSFLVFSSFQVFVSYIFRHQLGVCPFVRQYLTNRVIFSLSFFDLRLLVECFLLRC